MYGLSEDIDLSFLPDRELEHVTIGVYKSGLVLTKKS
jgi:hypothetical protein